MQTSSLHREDSGAVQPPNIGAYTKNPTQNNNEQAKKRMAEQSYSRVKEKFTWPVIAQQHLELFQQMAEQKT